MRLRRKIRETVAKIIRADNRKKLWGSVAALVMAAAVAVVQGWSTRIFVPSSDPFAALRKGAPLQYSITDSDSLNPLVTKRPVQNSTDLATILDVLAGKKPDAMGVALTDDLTTKIVFTGARDTGVTIVNIEPQHMKCERPYVGSLLHSLGGGAETETVSTTLDLDARSPQLLSVDTRAPAFSTVTPTLKMGEHFALTVNARTRRRACTWFLRVTYDYQGAAHTITLKHDKHNPFRLSASQPQDRGYKSYYAADFRSQVTKWTPMSQSQYRAVDGTLG
jgi:hypothetical protein